MGGGGPATRSHKSLSSRVAGSLQKALGLSPLPGLGLRRAPIADSQPSWLCNRALLNSATSPSPPLPAHQASHNQSRDSEPYIPNPKNPGRHLTRVFQKSLGIRWTNTSWVAVELDVLDCNIPVKAWVQIPELVLIGHMTFVIHLTSPHL